MAHHNPSDGGDEGAGDTPQAQQADEAQAPPSRWEWFAAAIGLLLLASSIGYLVFDALAAGNGLPTPVVQVLRVDQQPGGYLVQVAVHNTGRKTAAALRVAGELRRDGALLERSETEFSYLPGHSTREGGLFFRHDPATLQLEVGAVSYQQP